MKTKEELEAMTKEELVTFAMDEQEKRNLWFNHSQSIECKLTALKNSLQALLELVNNK